MNETNVAPAWKQKSCGTLCTFLVCTRTYMVQTAVYVLVKHVLSSGGTRVHAYQVWTSQAIYFVASVTWNARENRRLWRMAHRRLRAAADARFRLPRFIDVLRRDPTTAQAIFLLLTTHPYWYHILSSSPLHMFLRGRANIPLLIIIITNRNASTSI